MIIEVLNMLTYAYVCQYMLVEVLLPFPAFFLLWPDQKTARCFLERHKKSGPRGPLSLQCRQATTFITGLLSANPLRTPMS